MADRRQAPSGVAQVQESAPGVGSATPNEEKTKHTNVLTANEIASKAKEGTPEKEVAMKNVERLGAQELETKMQQAAVKAKEHFSKRGEKTQAEAKTRETQQKSLSREGAEKNAARQMAILHQNQVAESARKQAEKAREVEKKEQIAEQEQKARQAAAAAVPPPPALSQEEIEAREKKRRCVIEDKQCIDVNPTEECEVWAISGECHSNPVFMLEHCRKTCKACNLGAGGVPDAPICKDLNGGCGEWADGGQCAHNPDYMKKFCRKSCGFCSH